MVKTRVKNYRKRSEVEENVMKMAEEQQAKIICMSNGVLIKKESFRLSLK